MRQIKPNITMPEDLWKALQSHVKKLNERHEETSASKTIRTLVREYVEKSKKGGK